MLETLLAIAAVVLAAVALVTTIWLARRQMRPRYRVETKR